MNCETQRSAATMEEFQYNSECRLFTCVPIRIHSRTRVRVSLSLAACWEHLLMNGHTYDALAADSELVILKPPCEFSLQ